LIIKKRFIAIWVIRVIILISIKYPIKFLNPKSRIPKLKKSKST
jgi:hypothetical protein